MGERAYDRHRKEVFYECDLKPKNKHYSCHHIIEKNDVKRGLVPPDFPINNRDNLIPLPNVIHKELHDIMDTYFRTDISTRVYLANMAFIGELCDVPDRLYRTKVI